MNLFEKENDRVSNYGEIFKKLFFTLGILAVYHIANKYLFLPGIDLSIFKNAFAGNGNDYWKMANSLSGRGMEKCTVFALSIMPYISATILTQILSSNAGFEYFRELKKNKEMGAAKMNEWTQYFTLFIAGANAIAYSYYIFNYSYNGIYAVFLDKVYFFIISIFSLMAGSLLVVWIANQISRYGVGQGSSVIIFVNIIDGGVPGIQRFYDLFQKGVLQYQHLGVLFAFFSVIFLIVLYVEGATRNIKIKHPGIESEKAYSQIPLKVNNAGVIPPVIVSQIVFLPNMIIGLLQHLGFFTETLTKYTSFFNYGGKFYFFFYGFLLFTMAFTQTELVFDPNEIAQNLQESGVIITNVRPSDGTAIFLRKILNALNFLSGFYLVLVCVVSEYFCYKFNIWIGSDLVHLGGTSILIGISIAQIIFKSVAIYDYKKIRTQYQ